MMKKNKYNLIEEELSWLEERALEIKVDIENNPYNELKDRTILLAKGNSTIESVTASIESQKKAIRDSLKDYADILEKIKKLRAEEENQEVKARGNSSVSPRLQRILKQ